MSDQSLYYVAIQPQTHLVPVYARSPKDAVSKAGLTVGVAGFLADARITIECVEDVSPTLGTGL
jgi:hypothetical protein